MFQSVHSLQNAELVLLLSRTGGMALVRRLMRFGKGFLNSNKQAAVLWYGSLLLFSELIQIRNAEESLYVALLYW